MTWEWGGVPEPVDGKNFWIFVLATCWIFVIQSTKANQQKCWNAYFVTPHFFALNLDWTPAWLQQGGGEKNAKCNRKSLKIFVVNLLFLVFHRFCSLNNFTSSIKISLYCTLTGSQSLIKCDPTPSYTTFLPILPQMQEVMFWLNHPYISDTTTGSSQNGHNGCQMGSCEHPNECGYCHVWWPNERLKNDCVSMQVDIWGQIHWTVSALVHRFSFSYVW